MAALGPFERAPRLAVAVSGGSDSMALALLAKAWAADEGGTVTALIVDHGLRPESTPEALRVAAWLRARGVVARVLRWTGPKPATGIQAAARAARYGLLGDWCRRQGVLHLLVAHHREDQAETVWMRAARGSGVEGLAGMAASAERRGYRLLRPLLGQSREALRAVLNEIDQPWIDDPANADPRFERARLRAAWRAADAPGIDQILAHAAIAARARRQIDAATDALLGAAVAIHAEGYAEIVVDALRRVPVDLAERAVRHVVMTIGGHDHPPHREKIGRLCRALLGGGGSGHTLAGCRIVFRADGTALVAREQAAVTDRFWLEAGSSVLWDGRFHVTLAPGRGRFMVAALGSGRVGAGAPALPKDLPALVRTVLPALFDRHGLCEVPHLGWRRKSGRNQPARVAGVAFAPRKPLTSPGFNLA